MKLFDLGGGSSALARFWHVFLSLSVLSTQLLHSKASQALFQGDESPYKLQPNQEVHQGGYRRGDRGSKWNSGVDEWDVRDYQLRTRHGSGYGSGMMNDDDEDHWQISGSGSGYRDLGEKPPYRQVNHETSKEDDLFIENAYETPQRDFDHSAGTTLHISMTTLTMVTIAAILLRLNG